LHWLSNEDAVPAEFKLYDRLFKTPSPGALESIEAGINPDSLIVRKGLVSKDSLKEERVQFERLGFFLRNEGQSWTRIITLSDEPKK
jgi:glutaminyl-tRNA synthetase